MDDFHLEGPICVGTNGGDIDFGDVSDFVGCEILGSFVDLVRDGFWGWGTIGEVVFDAEVVFGA